MYVYFCASAFLSVNWELTNSDWLNYAPPPPIYVIDLTPSSSECICIRAQSVFQGDYVKMMSLGQGLIQYYWCLSKKKKIRYR